MDDYVGYARVSTDEQAREGFSLENQANRIRSYCELYDMNLLRIVEDPGVSAKSLKRHGWQEVAGMLDANEVKGVVIYKLDRLTRSVRDWSHLIDTYFRDRLKNVKQLHSYSEKIDTGTATGRMFLNVVMTIAEWERDIISERTLDGFNVKRSRGEKLGGRMPFGHDLADDGKTLVEDATELEAIKLMTRLRKEGNSLRAIGEALRQLGIETPQGNDVWAPCSILKILARYPDGSLEIAS